MIKNSSAGYGWLNIALHWLMAVAFIGMYFVGDYMVGLDYYDSWYHRAPELHKGIGIILVGLMIFRFFWVQLQTKPESIGHNTLVNKIAHLGHQFFYALILLLFVSGYLISTAKGKGIDVFELFEVPALLGENTDRGDFAGEIHEIVGKVFLLLSIIHASAALYHHFYLKDFTLKRMLGIKT